MGYKSGRLFEVPISDNGKVVVTRLGERVYMLMWNSAPDNRLTTSFCNAVHTALDILALKYPHGVVITTSGISKFYSNGLDLEHANSNPGFTKDSLFALWKRLLTYPMPTIALINGHGFAGALMTAMMHDYRIMNPHRGYICLNEVELGVPLKAAMSSIFRQKTSPQTYRTLVLEGKRFKALEALEAGIIDGVGGLDEVVAFVDELKLVSKTDKGVYGLLKREMWRETVAFLDAPDEEREYKEKVKKQDEELERKAKQRVKDWETAKAKL
ncbi:putative carnitinyl-CoA dehydratase [Aureobasidium sp. EXF-3400]|nr:putative carnitinyl-CoA dehydratase [Aureobasidium sp. EXF-12344]KAI4784036.1 putative carnitinyl-CoA dehydratase [Aureobasidium sp. EXF-3400]